MGGCCRRIAHLHCACHDGAIVMIIESELDRLIHQLIKDEIAEIKLGDSNIIVHVFERATKISLTSAVYVGENFIPMSVRKSLSTQPDFAKGALSNRLSLDEKNYRIQLHYTGNLSNLNKRMFVDLLEEFSWLAEQWRLFLDEHDKQDLVYAFSPHDRG